MKSDYTVKVLQKEVTRLRKQLNKRMDEVINGTDDKRWSRKGELETNISELLAWIFRIS